MESTITTKDQTRDVGLVLLRPYVTDTTKLNMSDIETAAPHIEARLCVSLQTDGVQRQHA